MIEKKHIPVVLIAAIVLALAFAFWAVRMMGGNPESDLMKAAFDNDVVMLEAIVNSGGDLNAITSEGWTAPMYAASGNNIDALRYLIRNGADLNVRNNDGKTALAIAEERQFTEVAELLKNEGAIK